MFICPSLFLDDRTEDGLSFLRVERINTISSSERMNYSFEVPTDVKGLFEDSYQSHSGFY
jgi:hypothetical protein